MSPHKPVNYKVVLPVKSHKKSRRMSESLVSLTIGIKLRQNWLKISHQTTALRMTIIKKEANFKFPQVTTSRNERSALAH